MPYTYDQFSIYLNIPDTNGRDSLFQAEARRCSEIVEKSAECAKNNTYLFCVFDELFSGTNPTEATKASIAFIRYLTNKFSNTDFMLTTHYFDVCDTFQKKEDQVKDQDKEDQDKQVKLMAMEVKETMDPIKQCLVYVPTYQLIPGVGKQHGAMNIIEHFLPEMEI